MKDLIICAIREEKLIRICEGDGCSLNSDDIKAGYTDYLYYDIWDLQDLDEIEDGGMLLCKKPINEEYDSLIAMVYAVFEMIFGEGRYPNNYILSGGDEWVEYFEKGEQS